MGFSKLNNMCVTVSSIFSYGRQCKLEIIAILIDLEVEDMLYVFVSLLSSLVIEISFLERNFSNN